MFTYLTQPLWRDEAFSVLFANHSFFWIITHSLPEPPLYYVFLHLWMTIFGQSEIAVRSLSFVGFALATVVVIYLSEHLFKKHWLSWFIPLLFFINPMLLYYSLETRAYGWYMFFAILAIYGYLKKNWKLFGLASVLGFYTHLYMILIPFVCTLHYLVSNLALISAPRTWFRDAYLKTIAVVGICISPLLIGFLGVASRFKNSWYYPVDINLIKSVLGNMYTGYEGTPWYGWFFTFLLSIVLLLLFGIAIIPRKTRSQVLFFLTMTILPLVIIIGISFVKPVFVARYLIPVTMTEVLLLGYAISAFRPNFLKIILALCLIGFSSWINIWFPNKHLKTDYRKPMREINALLGSNDVIYADNPLHFFETIYYARDKSRVYLYMPNGQQFPWYIGDAIVEPRHIVTQLPTYPKRAFVLRENRSFTVEYELPL
jgi:uncharacterized membrane protein